MSNVSSVCNMTHRNEIRLVWFHTEHVSTHNDTKVTFGGGYNLYRHSHSTCYFFLPLRLVFRSIASVSGCIIFTHIKPQVFIMWNHYVDPTSKLTKILRGVFLCGCNSRNRSWYDYALCCEKSHTEICDRVSLFIQRGLSVWSDVCPVHERWKKLSKLL